MYNCKILDVVFGLGHIDEAARFESLDDRWLLDCFFNACYFCRGGGEGVREGGSEGVGALSAWCVCEN